MFKKDGAIAVSGDLRHAVADEQDGLADGAEAVETIKTLFLERHVTDGKDLVDDENVRVDFGRQGKPHIHSGRLFLYGGVDEVADIGEIDNTLLAGQHLAPGEPEQEAVQDNVFAACQFGVEAGSEFVQGGERAGDGDGAGGRFVDTGNHFKQSALARAIASDDADHLALAHFEGHIADGVKLLVMRLVAEKLRE